MLTEDVYEPLIREAAHFLALCGAPCGSSWDGYGRDEDLLPLARTSNDLVEYVRAANGQARVRAFNCGETAPDPESIVWHPEIVLASKRVATASFEIDNLHSARDSEPHVFRKAFRNGESEADAVEASVVNETWGEAKVSGGFEGVAEGEASTGFRTTLSASWARNTGRTRDEETGGDFPFSADAHSRMEARLQWDEQTKQRRWEGDARLACGIEIGRRTKRKRGWRWSSGSPQWWASIDHLLAVAEKRGRVEHALYGFFARRALSADERESLDRIKRLRLRHVDKLTPEYKGAADIKVGIVSMEMAE